MKKLVLIDGNAILHRAYHALPPLTTSKGELVNAVYGFCSMLLKVRDEINPSCLAVTFDLPKPTFRKKLFDGYQAKRPKMLDELSGQVERVKELVRILGIPIYEKEGYEADDVIGTLAYQAVYNEAARNEFSHSASPGKLGVTSLARSQNTGTESGKSAKMSKIVTSRPLNNNELEVIIVTGDRDLLQLVDDQTKVYMLIKGLTEATLFDEDKVVEKYGLKPSQIPDYKGLIGDQSDNYSGVSGIGPKTAVNLLQRYITIEQIYDDIDKITEGIREKLVKGKKDGKLSKQLATIITDVPVRLDLEKCTVKDFVKPEVIKFLEELEFYSLIKRLEKKESSSAKATEDKKNEQMGLF